MQFDLPKPGTSATTMQFESEPAGAEAKTSLGQACRTPCSLAVSASEFTVNFALPGYQPQTVPVRIVASADSREAGGEGESAPPRLVPNPVFVELTPAGAALRRSAPVAQAKPKPKPKPVAAARPAPTAMAPSPPPPEAAPASPWPPSPSR